MNGNSAGLHRIARLGADILAPNTLICESRESHPGTRKPSPQVDKPSLAFYVISHRQCQFRPKQLFSYSCFGAGAGRSVSKKDGEFWFSARDRDKLLGNPGNFKPRRNQPIAWYFSKHVHSQPLQQKGPGSRANEALQGCNVGRDHESLPGTPALVQHRKPIVAD